jgi:hypothetical protein
MDPDENDKEEKSKKADDNDSISTSSIELSDDESLYRS